MIGYLARRITAASETTERGAVSLFVAITGIAVILAGGLIIDGGRKLQAGREAASVAEEAARAGAGQVDQNTLYADGGEWTIDPDKAIAAANGYLADSGHDGTAVLADSGQTVEVTVTITRPASIINLFGIGQIVVTRVAKAELVQGVEGENE